MKNNEPSLFSLSKLTTNEILVEEQLEQLESVRFQYFKRYLSSQESLKRRFLLSKIFGAIIFGILPIIPLLTYFEVLSFINEGNVPIELVLFAGSLLFGIYFLFQFFNFFLMAMLNTMKILSGTIFEWFETLPLSRAKLKKLILLTIIRSLDIPLIAITVVFPIIMLIGTQDVIIFLICMGISTLDTLFSLALLILFSERLNRILNINKIGSKKAHSIRIANLAIYIIIVIGSIFLIQWTLNSINHFFMLFVRSQSPTLIVMILSLIPYPIAPGYLISSFISPSQIPLFIWYNIFIGFSLFLILAYLIYQQSIKGIKKSSYSRFKIDKKINTRYLATMESSIKIKIRSPVWAYVHKDFKISTRDLKTFLSIAMPIVIGFIFTFTYYSTNLGGINPFEIDFIFNMFVIIGLNLIISGMIIHGLLNFEESGASILASLPLIPRDQAKAKLILMLLVQTITVLAPSLMYITQAIFWISLFTALMALPIILLFLFLMFEMRIYFFGKSKNIFIIEEVKPEKKLTKWSIIFVVEYSLYFLTLFIFFIIYGLQGLRDLLLFEMVYLFIGFIFTYFIFRKLFSLKRLGTTIKEKEFILPIEGKPTWFTQHTWISVMILFGFNLLVSYAISLFPPLRSQFFPFENWLDPTLYNLFYIFIFNIFYVLLWIFINPLTLGLPSGKKSIKHYLNLTLFGEETANRKKITLSIIIAIIIFLLNFSIILTGSGEIPLLFALYFLFTLIVGFSYCFWQEFAFRGIIFTSILSKLNKWKAIILTCVIYSIIQIFYLFIIESFISITISNEIIYQRIIFLIFIEFLYHFLVGIFLTYLYIKTNNLIIISSIAGTLSFYFHSFIIYMLAQSIFYPF